MPKRYVLYGILSIFFWQAALAEPLSLKSSKNQVGLVELYTSEGCSSCPPADKWLSSLKTNSELWKNVVPVAFHVDYWDYIGWKDRFASPDYSQRQRQYARQRSLSTVYTPGFMLNGREWRRWFGLRKLNFPKDNIVGVLGLTVYDGKAKINFKAENPIDNDLVIHVALLGAGLKTKIGAGENSGRELYHDFVVLGLNQASLTLKGGAYSGIVSLPKSDINAPRNAIAAWVSAKGDQRPIQAVGGWLPGT